MQKDNSNKCFYLDGWLVEPAICRVSKVTCEFRLEPKVMDVLVILASAAPEVVRKDELLRAVWGDVNVVDNVLARVVSSIRRVFGDDRKHPRVIETIPRIGYRLVAPVSSADEIRTDADAERDVTHPRSDGWFVGHRTAFFGGAALTFAMLLLALILISASGGAGFHHEEKHIEIRSQR